MATLRTYGAATDALAPLAHWRFDETEGSTAVDQADGLDGVYQGAPAPVDGVIGDGAARFDGAGTFVEVATAGGDPVRLAFIGDSLVAGFGFTETTTTFDGVTDPVPDAFPSDLTLALQGEGFEIEPVVDGRSDRYTEEALDRVDDVLAREPDAVVLVLGTNDSLNGVDPAETAANLDQIIRQFQAEGVEVLLSGFFGLWPDEVFGRPGYDTTDPENAEALATEYEAIYPALAAELGVDLFDTWHGGERIGSEIVGGTLGDPALNQGDGVHPNAAGVDQIVERILPQARALVEAAGGGDGGGEDPLAIAAGSIEMWVQPDVLEAPQALFAKGAEGGAVGHIAAALLADGAVAVTLIGPDGPVTLQSDTEAVSAGQIAQIVVGFGPGGLQLYVDGELVAEDAFTGGLADNTEPLLIGSAADGEVAELAGVVDEFVIHGQQLSGAQVAELFQAGSSGGVLIGTGGDDLLVGGVDDDALEGRGGGDELLGGPGDDRLQGSRGRDALSGEEDADRLFGGKGWDELRGGDGADLLDGGLGKDLLVGGADADVFRLSALDHGVDKVADFEAGPDADVLDLSAVLDFDGGDANDFVELIPVEGNTEVAVDPDGQGGESVVVFNLLDVTGLSVDQLMADENLQLT